MSRLINGWRLPFYAGFINFPSWGINMQKWKHKPAITEKEFYKIANKFKMRDFYRDYTPNDISNKLQLRRVLRCWCCWWLLSWSSTHWHWWQYFYYYCFNEKCPCFRKSYNSDKINSEVEKLLWMLTLDESYMKSFKVVIDALWEDRWEIEKEQLELKEKRLKEIDGSISSIVDKIATTNSDIVYKALEEKIKALDKEKQQIQADLLTSKLWTMDNCINEFNSLQSIIQCPLNAWQQDDIELRRLLIVTIFNNTLSYSNEKWLRTSEIPLVYTQNIDVQEKIGHKKKSQLRTSNSIDETQHIESKSSILG